MKKLFLALVAIFSIYSISSAQMITTIGGNGVVGYSGNGGPATDAELDTPNGMGIDAAGNVYSANTTSNCITKISTSGILTIVAGIGGIRGYNGDGGPATAAELYGPNEVTFDKPGNMYIVERYNNDVRMVNTSGIISTVAGSGNSTWSGDGGPATAAGINDPGGVAVDNKGNIYIAEYGSSVIRKVNASGIISTIAGQVGNPGYNGDGIAATSAQINMAIGIAVDTTGNVYIGDNYNNRVRIINTSGIINTLAGNGNAAFSGDGGPATAAELNWPDHLFIDKNQNLYFGDWSNDRVREINTSGIISTVAGNGASGFTGDGGPATAAELRGPSGVVVSLAGNVYIDDISNSRVREIIFHNSEGINTITPASESIFVSPNPAKDIIYLKIQNSIKAEKVVLYSITGQKIFDSRLEGKQSLEISTYGLSNGLYFLTVLTDDGTTLVNKVEVAR
jgi:trimeric autotransporter adhesin